MEIAQDALDKIRAATEVLGVISRLTKTERDNELYGKASNALDQAQAVIDLVERRAAPVETETAAAEQAGDDRLIGLVEEALNDSQALIRDIDPPGGSVLDNRLTRISETLAAVLERAAGNG